MKTYIVTYHFYLSVGVPVFDWPSGKTVTSYRFRRTTRLVLAHSLTESTEKLAKSLITKHGVHVKLNLEQAFVSKVDKPATSRREDWTELNLDAFNIAAFVVGSNARRLLA